MEGRQTMRAIFPIVAALIAFNSTQSAFGDDDQLPWGQSADMVAWEEFAQITAPSGSPTSKKVEFETWAS